MRANQIGLVSPTQETRFLRPKTVAQEEGTNCHCVHSIPVLNGVLMFAEFSTVWITQKKKKKDHKLLFVLEILREMFTVETEYQQLKKNVGESLQKKEIERTKFSE